MWNLGERGCVRGVDHLEISLFLRHFLLFSVSRLVLVLVCVRIQYLINRVIRLLSGFLVSGS